MKIFINLKSFDLQKGTIKAWMSSIFIRICLDKIRLKSNQFYNNLIDITEAEDLFIAYDQYSTDDLMEVISKMPEGYRVIFNLYAIEGYDHNEIALLLDISSSTSRSQFYRSKKWLMKKLSKSKFWKYG